MSESRGSSGGEMELPQIAINQAEAAAIANQGEDAGPPTDPVSNSKPEFTGSQENKTSSMRDAQAHAKEHQTPAAGETPIEQVPQVPFGSQLGQVDFSQDGFDTRAKVAGKLTPRAVRLKI